MGDYRGSVLLALSEPCGRDALAAALRESGLEVQTAPDREPLASFAAAAFDVLVLSAPASASGAALAAADARRRDPEIEILIAAAPDALAPALASVRQGTSEVLPLPLDPDGLLEAVLRALSRRSARGLAAEALRLARSASLGQLTPSIAHEIVNPLAIILSGVEGIGESLDALDRLGELAGTAGGLEAVIAWWERDGQRAQQQARELLAEACEGGQRLKLLARDLRAMARADPAVVDGFALEESLEAAMRIGRAELTSRLQISSEIPPGFCVVGNKGALAQAILCLLLRASQAAAVAGLRTAHVRVAAHRDEMDAVVEIEDEIELPATAAPARHLGGLLPDGAPPGPGALGLAVARDLLERQGGGLLGRPRAGGGTCFELRLVPGREPSGAKRGP